MEKKYTLEDENKKDNDSNGIDEPIAGYEINQQQATTLYDIPENYLRMRLKQAEKEIVENNGISHEEVVKRFLG
ncbi:MAG: hypothetical protein LUH10_00675 [Tannerellaceae bacterium]|nr:hypothetical protein [Tannerellaceae bacterium]